MPRVLAALEAVSEAEAHEKQAELRALRPAFTFRMDSTVERPAAAEFMLSEACYRAKQWQRHRNKRVHEETAAATSAGGASGADDGARDAVPMLSRPLAGGLHERCTFS